VESGWGDADQKSAIAGLLDTAAAATERHNGEGSVPGWERLGWPMRPLRRRGAAVSRCSSHMRIQHRDVPVACDLPDAARHLGIAGLTAEEARTQVRGQNNPRPARRGLLLLDDLIGICGDAVPNCHCRNAGRRALSELSKRLRGPRGARDYIVTTSKG